MRISDWSSDLCSSDLERARGQTDVSASGQRETHIETVTGGIGVGADDVGLVHDRLGDVALEARQADHQLDVEAEALAVVAWADRSEERRVGKECGSTCRSRGAAYSEKTNKKEYNTRKNTIT